jgi:hypothetical protein
MFQSDNVLANKYSDVKVILTKTGLEDKICKGDIIELPVVGFVSVEINIWVPLWNF